MIEKLRIVRNAILFVPFLVVWGIISALSSQPHLTPLVASPTDWLMMPVGAFIALLVSKLIAEWLAYLLVWLNVPEKWRGPIQYVGNLMLVALVTGIAHFIPQPWLDKTLLEAILALLAMIVSWAGSFKGALSAMSDKLRLTQQLNSAGVHTEYADGLLDFKV